MIELAINSLGFQVDSNWDTVVRVLQPNDVLPVPDRIDTFYMDFETTSGSPDKKSINPFRTCKILGVAFMLDEDKTPYYIPVRHAILNDDGSYSYRTNGIVNVDPVRVLDWLEIVLGKAKKWTNHNIKYDLQVLLNERACKKLPKLVDTLALCKLAAYEEKFSYGLTEMMRHHGVDITEYEKCIKKHLGKTLQDYGLIPPDEMAVYAAVDVLAVRYLIHKLQKDIHGGCQEVVDMEIALLPKLAMMERIGMRTNIPFLLSEWHRILDLQYARVKRMQFITDMPRFDPGDKKDLKELFCDRLGWALDFTAKSYENIAKGIIDESEATYSFDKANIAKHKDSNPELVDTFLSYQEDAKLLSAFIQPYVEQHTVAGIIHPSINQIVRTGRMSCMSPNMMQLSPRAKEFIIPYSDDHVLVDFDLSQIEFRVIVHYIQNKKCITDYNENPATDFHQWVAEECVIERKPAKNVNFMLGYGGGKKKCLEMLSSMPSIIATGMAQETATNIYNSYHRTLPELKPTQRRATSVAQTRGYVKTLYGRRRYLNPKFSFKGFNSVCQGTAADILKLITLKLTPLMSMDCLLHMLIHDSWVFSIHKSIVNDVVPIIKGIIESELPIPLSVPLVSDYSISATNWRGCNKDWREHWTQPN